MLSQDQFLQLLHGALRGDKRCERLIYEGYVGFAYNLARKYGFSDDDAADVAQEALIIAFEKIKKYQADKGTFKSWLAKITINVALKMKKKLSVHTSMENLDQLEELVPQIDARIFKLQDVLPRLDAEQQELYTLYFEYGMNHQEVADSLSISTANSRVRMHRLVKQLKTLFQ
jgi:RNA polymerase sigma-70 factor (ECF subfamily)